MPSNIIVSVFDPSGVPLKDAAVTLTGNGTPQNLVTDATGKGTFQNLPTGKYKIVVVHEKFNTIATTFDHVETADTQVRVDMKVVSDSDSEASKRFFRRLTVAEYVFLFFLAGVFAVILYKGVAGSDLNLADTNAARGMITYVVAVTTVAIAFLLVMSAALLSGSKDLDRRFAFGKEVFTVLVGVLGTIMGFYYGQAAAAKTEPTIQVLATELKPTSPQVGANFTLTGTITGGEKPYKYIVEFDNPAAVKNSLTTLTESADGKISQTFTVADDPKLAGQSVGYQIKVTDKNGLTGTSGKGAFTPTAAAAAGAGAGAGAAGAGASTK